MAADGGAAHGWTPPDALNGCKARLERRHGCGRASRLGMGAMTRALVNGSGTQNETLYSLTLTADLVLVLLKELREVLRIGQLFSPAGPQEESPFSLLVRPILPIRAARGRSAGLGRNSFSDRGFRVTGLWCKRSLTEGGRVYASGTFRGHSQAICLLTAESNIARNLNAH